MEDKKISITDDDVKRIMLEIPHGFSVGDEHFLIYQPSLAKVYINSMIIREIGIEVESLKNNSLLECLRVAKDNPFGCCQYIAYQTFNKKDDVLDYTKVMDRTSFLMKNLETDEIAILFAKCNESISVQDCIKLWSIDEDSNLRDRVNRAKKNNNTFIFGGKSIYGGLIGSVIEKYHWTYDYVLWGVSYANIQLLMADAITTIYVSDEERKNGCLPSPNAKKTKVTAANIEEIKKKFK